MKAILTTTAALLALSGAAFAQDGDVEAGESEFRKCKSCHAITDAEGNDIVKGGKTGPNLYNIVGRQAGTDEDFSRYSDTLVELGEEGLVWTAEDLAAYIPDAKAFLRERSGDDSARSAMTPQRVKNIDDVVAFLVSVSPDAEMAEEGEEEATN